MDILSSNSVKRKKIFDDVDFIGQDYVNINKIQETLHKYQLKVNKYKTEFTAL